MASTWTAMQESMSFRKAYLTYLEMLVCARSKMFQKEGKQTGEDTQGLDQPIKNKHHMDVKQISMIRWKCSEKGFPPLRKREVPLQTRPHSRIRIRKMKYTKWMETTKESMKVPEYLWSVQVPSKTFTLYLCPTHSTFWETDMLRQMLRRACL